MIEATTPATANVLHDLIAALDVPGAINPALAAHIQNQLHLALESSEQALLRATA